MAIEQSHQSRRAVCSMSASDTESGDFSTDTDAKRACKQISIYDKHSVCLDALLTSNNKKFTSRYKEEVATSQEYFAVPMYQHGSQSETHICGRPNAVWSVLNARTMHYTEQHRGKRPDPKQGIIWACLRAEQPTSQVIRFIDGPERPSSAVIQSVLDVSKATETESQPEAAAEQAVPVAEAEHADAQTQAEPAKAQTQLTEADHAEAQTQAEHTEAQTNLADLFANWDNLDNLDNPLIDDLDPGGDEQLLGMQQHSSVLEDDPFTIETGKQDVVRSLAAVLRKRQLDEADARNVVEGLTRKQQKLQQEHQVVADQRNHEILRLHDEIEVKKSKLLQLKSEVGEHLAAFQQQEADIRAEQTTAEDNLKTKQENLQKWSQLNSLLHDDDLQ